MQSAGKHDVPSHNLSPDDVAVGKALVVAASNGHVEAVSVLNEVARDGGAKARAVVSAAARGKDKVVMVLRSAVPREALMDVSIIGPLQGAMAAANAHANVEQKNGASDLDVDGNEVVWICWCDMHRRNLRRIAQDILGVKLMEIAAAMMLAGRPMIRELAARELGQYAS